MIRGTSSRDPTDDDGPDDQRSDVRWTFKGTAFPVRMGKKELAIRLKDLSRRGACGLMEEPVAIGDYIFIAFDDRHVIEAQVRWVRRLMVGLKLSTMLPASFVARLSERSWSQDSRDDAE